ncbi:MAG TPA: RDD family protein [Gammaproteobacteria bacterium]|nr:RDD family protein [Gammaproteobacteria bacterium]
MNDAKPAPFWRRMAAIFYDSLILIALWMLAVFLILLISHTGGKPLGEAIPQQGLWHAAYQLFLVGIAFLFFAWFWTRSGQTAGMMAWKIKIQQINGEPITWRQALIRFLAAILSWMPVGLGFWWALFSTDRCTWHDLLSGTRLVKK